MVAHVVDAEERRAALEGRNGRADRRGWAARLRVCVAEQPPEGALARDPDQDRTAQPGQHGEPAQERERVLDRLAEAEAGVEADALLGDAGGDRERASGGRARAPPGGGGRGPRTGAAPRGTPRPPRRRRRSADRLASSAARP